MKAGSQYIVQNLGKHKWPKKNFKYKCMSDTVLLWTVFMFPASNVLKCNAC